MLLAFDRGVGERRLAEQPRERELAGVVEVVLVAEEHHLVRQQRGPDPGDGVRGEFATEADPVDARTDASAQFVDSDGSGKLYLPEPGIVGGPPTRSFAPGHRTRSLVFRL
ncbi:hypothetical protein [Actinocrispum sp. NPDC049592]|uniref:hypothetical protein n=1 Tax=Actinocrispum sp. NPDC049592 TaxID=3154835 RepID=UPI00343198DD